jgi:large repetitive protein
LSTSTTQSTCGGSNGTATVTPSGGTAPYTFSWAPAGGNAATATGLSAGSYTVTVTDANGCTATAVAVVVSASGPAANISASTNVSCFGGCNGSATVSLIGGTAPFTYAWTPSGGNAATATGLCAGTYTITVTDANACTSSASVTITQPTIITATMSTPVNVSCFGGCNGSVIVTAGGGTPGYTYSWAPSGGNSFTATGLCAGTYTVTVTDANGCTRTATAIITQPTLLTASTVVTPVLCFGGCNGTSTVTGSGGTPGYTYSWAPSGGNAATATGLCAGTYTVTVTDANGCTQTATSTIVQPTALALTMAATQSTCGLPNGTATVTVTGGTPAYSYLWAPSGGNAATATGLATGTYTVTVTDANGCTATASILVPSANSPVINISASTNVTCFGLCNGTANSSVTGGTPPYVYAWAPAGGNGANATGLCAGTFTVTVTDANGCTSTAAVTITQPTLVTAAISGSTNVSCFGGNNGSATVVAAGGTSPYTYVWAPSGGNNATGSNLIAGNYTVTVTDANGCTATATVTITEPTVLQLAVSGFPATCNGLCNGTAAVIPSGGTPNYTFVWMPGNLTTASINALCVGIYTVVVSDGNGCTASDTAIVTEPTAISLVTSFTTAYCGQADGTASVVASGGTPTYTYSWAPTGGNSANATGLLAGIYTVTVTDLQGCTLTATVVIPNATGVAAAITASAGTSCFNNCDGTATVTPTGGNAPYTYAWAPSGGNAATATGLCAGTYTVTVTDFNGCTDTAIVTILQPQQLVLNSITPQVICNGQTATLNASANGGNAPYTFTWNPGNLTGASVTVSPTSTTTYTVTVTDVNGCTAATQTVQVTVRPPLVVSGSPDVAICTGGSTTLTAFASGGNGGPYTITWNPGNLNGSPVTVNPTSTTTYTVIVTDGCTVLPATDTIVVTVNPLPVITFTTNPTPAAGCAPLCVDFVNSTPNGATCAWNFTVGTSSSCNTTFCFTNPGSYDVTLTVTDLNGCVNTLVQPSYVTVYPVPVADFTMTPQPTTILGGPIQFFDLSSGTPVIWDWSFGDVGNSSSNIQNPGFQYPDTGSYTVQLIVENQYGCRDTTTKILRVDQDFTLFAPNAFTPDGNGVNDEFFPLGEGVDPDNFKMWIFDRWGNLIFETDLWGKGWDGKANGGADIAQEDVYVWKIELRDFAGMKHSYVGHVSLIK